jgi:hypothetical protein
MLNHFAGMDEYRYELYTDLKKLKQLSLFPEPYNNQLAIARSQLLSAQSYNKPDTIVFMNKLPLQYKDRSGYVYVFKYKEKKEDNSWKLGTVGLLPKDEAEYEFKDKDEKKEEAQAYDFTDITGTKLAAETSEKEQLQKLLKKLLYSKRKSAAQFYTDSEKYGDVDIPNIRF